MHVIAIVYKIKNREITRFFMTYFTDEYAALI